MFSLCVRPKQLTRHVVAFHMSVVGVQLLIPVVLYCWCWCLVMIAVPALHNMTAATGSADGLLDTSNVQRQKQQYDSVNVVDSLQSCTASVVNYVLLSAGHAGSILASWVQGVCCDVLPLRPSVTCICYSMQVTKRPYYAWQAVQVASLLGVLYVGHGDANE
mgnify:CR=1 FL=1